MAFNDLMHPRNIYKHSPPDFKKLADKIDYFRKFTKEAKNGNVTVNFKDPEALRALTCALLENDFDLKLSIPVDRLIPTVPLRLNYILWIEDLLQCLPEKQARPAVRGFDIGTGASCIYPLLGAKLNGWKFVASEVDESSVSYAEKNVKQNGLDSIITVKTVVPGSFLKTPLEDDKNMEFDFCMCNPPFFVSEFEASHGITRSNKRPQPSGVCTGTESETVTGGGEVEFVKGIIRDSMSLKEQFRWYTTMLGKKSSLVAVLACLRENNIQTVTTTEFCQGRTMRWGVAWSFLPDVVVEESPSKRRKRTKKSKPLQLVFPDGFTASQAGGTEQQTADHIANYVKKMLNELKVNWQEQQSTDDIDKSRRLLVLHCNAVEKSWAHQRRKRRENLRKSSSPEHSEEKTVCLEVDTEKQRNDDLQSDIATQDVSKEDNSEGKGSADILETFRHSVANVCSEQALSSQACETTDRTAKPLFSFMLRVGNGAQTGNESPSNGAVLEMEWLDGEDKNDFINYFSSFKIRFQKEFNRFTAKESRKMPKFHFSKH